MATIVACFADTHTNSRVGLLPPVVELEGGEQGPITIHASKAQQALWAAWLHYWDELARLKKEHNAQLYAVQVGDGSDDNTHGKVGLISTHKADIVKMGVEVLTPAIKVADKIFIVRGTEAHVGPGAWQEEMIAGIVGAERDAEAHTDSWWWLPMEVEGVRFHIAHHPPTRSWVPWTRQDAASRSASYISNEYWQRGQMPPDVAVFGHVHFLADGGRAVRPQVVFCPSWQLTTTYAMRLGKAGMTQAVGGVWFICQGGEYEFDYATWHTKEKGAWTDS